MSRLSFPCTYFSFPTLLLPKSSGSLQAKQIPSLPKNLTKKRQKQLTKLVSSYLCKRTDRLKGLFVLPCICSNMNQNTLHFPTLQMIIRCKWWNFLFWTIYPPIKPLISLMDFAVLLWGSLVLKCAKLRRSSSWAHQRKYPQNLFVIGILGIYISRPDRIMCRLREQYQSQQSRCTWR